MSFFVNGNPTPVDQIQNRLMRLAAFFLLVYSVILTLAPAVRLHSWQVEYRWNHWIGFTAWLVGMALIHHQTIRRLPDRDPFLLPIGALLSGWGLLSVWRLDLVMGARQTLWLIVCLGVFVAGLRLRNLMVFLRRYKYFWLTSGLLLTGLTFLFGTYPGGIGPRLWLGCCGVYLQPSEPLKLLLIIYLAAYLADRLPVSLSLMELLTPTLILIGAALALLVAQRDLGTASLFILIYSVVVYLASRRRRMLIISLIILIIAGITGYLLFDVVRIRVDAWIDPWLDPTGRSFQIVQSLLAVASGGFLGSGPGLGSPGIVPVSHSDFIFSSIAEETGLLGTVGLLALFGLLVGRGFRTALFATSNYQRYLSAGITAYLVIQAIFITGGNLRLLPLTGVTLPFVSYGGSSLLTAYISLLLLLLISSRGEEETAPLSRPLPYLVVSGGLMLGLLALALVAGWWSVVRRDALLSRPDNPRRVIAERYVPRGDLLDRNNQPISSTDGQPGDYHRLYQYPALSGTAGYNNPQFGQAGLEAGLDDYLRGLRGNPPTQIWLQEQLYGQPPPGLDVRLTIEIEVQRQADQLLAGHTGALVLMNARTGELLAVASHPNFDPNQMDSIWPDLIQDPSAPLLNRATQGQYPPGAALGPFLYAYVRGQGKLPALPDETTYQIGSETWTCALAPQPPVSSAEKIASGCPAALATIGRSLGAENLSKLFRSLGFYETPDLPLDIPQPSVQAVEQAELAAIGQEGLSVTPLQMALAAAALSNNGMRPSPQLAAAVLHPTQGWTLLPNEGEESTVLAGGTPEILNALSPDDALYWQTVALARSNETELTWYLAGTLPEWEGAPLVLALLLEERNPQLAVQIGQALLNSELK